MPETKPFWIISYQGKAREGETKEGKAREGKAREDKGWEVKGNVTDQNSLAESLAWSHGGGCSLGNEIFFNSSR